MKVRNAGYWLSTALVALALAVGGAFDLVQSKQALEGLAQLGYPAYFAIVLGAWKLLGALAIVAPRLPLLKEWAYAGIVFDLSGAAFSHAAVGDGLDKLIPPLVLLGLAVASWALRPADRTLAATRRAAPGQASSSAEWARPEAA